MSDDDWDAVEDAAEMLLAGEHQQALEALRAVLERTPSNPYAFNYVGAALYELGRWPEAATAYRSAVKLAPKYLAAHIGLSHALRRSGQPQGAIAAARQALRHFEDDADALHALGLAQAGLANASDPKTGAEMTAAAVRTLTRFLQTQPQLEVELEVRAIIESLRPPPS